MSRNQGSLGLVAIGKDEGERLKACLRSIPRHIDVVYVDSGSQDGSVEFARSTGALVVQLEKNIPFTAARARNEGLRALLRKTPDIEFVQFIDGDCELEKEWLKLARSFLEAQEAYAVVCGRRRERFPEASFYNRMCDEEWDTPAGDADACGGDALYRVSAFVAAGGFDPSIIAGEEPELSLRLRTNGWKIRRLDAPMTIHDADMTQLHQWWMRTVRSGFGYAQVWWKTRTNIGTSIYGRQVASALLWTVGLITFSITLAVSFGPQLLFFGPVIWLLQLTRLGLRFGWAKACHLLIGKIAEAYGALRFAKSAIFRRQHGAIFYK